MNIDFYFNTITGSLEYIYQLYIGLDGGLRLKRCDPLGSELETVLVDTEAFDVSIVADPSAAGFVYICYRRNGTGDINMEFVVRKYSGFDLTTQYWSSVYQFAGLRYGYHPVLYLTGSPSKAPYVYFTDEARKIVNLFFNASTGFMTKRTELRGLSGTSTVFFNNYDSSKLVARAFDLNVYLAFPHTSSLSEITIVKVNGKTGSRVWQSTLNFETPSAVKSSMRIVEDNNNSIVYIYAKTGSERRIAALDSSTGGFLWTSPDISSELTGSIDTDIHAFQLFKDTPLITTVLSSGGIKTFKLSLGDGSISIPRTTSLTGLGTLGSGISAYILFPGEDVYISSLNGNLQHRQTASINNIVYPESEVGQNQLVVNSAFDRSYWIYRNNSEMRMSVMGFDNTVIQDYLIDSTGGQLPTISLNGVRLMMSNLSFYTNFTEYATVRVYHTTISEPETIVWSSSIDTGIASIVDAHPVLVTDSGFTTVFLKRHDGFVQGFVFKSSSGALNISRTLKDMRINSRIGFNYSSTTAFLSGVKYGETQKVLLRLYGISSLNSTFPYETDFEQALVQKTATYVTGIQQSDSVFVGARGDDGNLYITRVTKAVADWTLNSGITDTLNNEISDFTVFSDNLLIFSRNAASGHLKTYKYSTTGFFSSVTLDPSSYFPIGSTTLPPTGTVTGNTCIRSVFPYDKYVVVSRTSNTSGPIRIASAGISILHGGYVCSGSFTNFTNILTIDTSPQNHRLVEGEFINANFSSSNMVDGMFRVIEVESPTVFKIDYARVGILSGTLTFVKNVYDMEGTYDLSENQAIYSEGSKFITYVDEQINLTLKKIDDQNRETTVVLKNDESVGQNPSISVFQGFLHMGFISKRITLTDITYFTMKRFRISNMLTEWTTSTRSFPDSDKAVFQINIVETDGFYIYAYHYRDDRYLYRNAISVVGFSESLVKTNYVLPPSIPFSKPTLKALDGNASTEYMYPEGTTLKLFSFDSSTLEEKHSMIIDTGINIPSDSMILNLPGPSNEIRYISLSAGTSNKLVRYNPETGTVLWMISIPLTSPVFRIYEYIGYVILFSITGAGNVVTLKITAEEGVIVSGSEKTTALVNYLFANIVGKPVFYSESEWYRAIIFLRNSAARGVPTSSNYLEYEDYSSPLKTTVTDVVTELSNYQSAVQPAMILPGATYTQTENIITVSYTNHGLLLNSRVGLKITSGGASGGSFTVISSGENSFKVMAKDFLTVSGELDIYVFDNFFTCYYTDSENGIELTKFLSAGNQYQISLDPLGQSPSILHDEQDPNYVYATFIKNVTSFVDYLELVVRRLNTKDLTEDWGSAIIYMDTSPLTYRPRLAVCGQYIYVGYCRQTERIHITTLDKTTGNILETTDTGFSLSDPSLLEIYGAYEKLYIAYIQSTNIVLRQYQTVNGVLTHLWTSIFDGGELVVKQNLKLRPGNDGLFAAYDTGTSNYVTRLNADGGVVWTIDITEAGAYENLLHGFYILNDSVIAFFVVPRISDPNLADVVSKKYNVEGSLINSRTTFLETFDGKLVNGPPLLFSRLYTNPLVEAGNVYNTLWMVYPDPTGPLYPNWVILVNRLEVDSIPVINFSLVQTTDNQYARDESSGLIYNTYINDPGINGVYVNRIRPDGITDKILRVDSGGYGSVLTLNDEHLYMAFSKNVIAYTDYITIELRKYTKDNLIPVWGVTRVFSDSDFQFFFPRIRVQGNNLFLLYSDQFGTLHVERYSTETGALIDFMNAGVEVTPAELGDVGTWASDNHYYFSIPVPSSDSIIVQKYGVESGSITRLYSITYDPGVPGQKSGIVLRTADRDNYTHEENLLVGFSNTNSQYISKFSPQPLNDLPLWTINVGAGLETFTNRIHGLEMYGDYTLAFILKNVGGNISVFSIKLSPEGSILQENLTTTPLQTPLISTTVNGGTPITINVSPVILSSRDWQTLYVEFYVNAYIPYGEPVSPYDRLVVTALEVSPTYPVTIPDSELSIYQFSKTPNDMTTDMIVVYRHESEGIKISRLDKDGTILETRLVNINGQTPSLTILDDKVYVSYTYQKNGFLSSLHHEMIRYDLDLQNETIISSYNYPDVFIDHFRPRISSFEQKIVVNYFRDDNQLVMETIHDSEEETLLSIFPLSGDVFGGSNYLNLSNTMDGETYIIYPTNPTETEYLFKRVQLDGTELWSIPIIASTPISPSIKVEDSSSVIIYYTEGLITRTTSYYAESGTVKWSHTENIPNLVGNNLSNVYLILGYTFLFALDTSGILTVLKLDDLGEFRNTISTNLSSVIVSPVGRPVILSDNPWERLYYAYYTTTPSPISIPVSTTRFIQASSYYVTPTHTLPIPDSELSEHQIAETTGEIFIVQSDQTNGLVVLKIDKLTKTIVGSFNLPVDRYAFAPSIAILGDRLLLSHVEYVVTFADFILVNVTILSLSDLTSQGDYSFGFPDGFPDTFLPRVFVTDEYVYMGLVRFDRDVYILPFNPETREFGKLFPTGVSTGTSAPYIDPLSLTFHVVGSKIFLVLPDLEKNILMTRYSEEFNEVTNTYINPSSDWSMNFDGNSLNPKPRPLVKHNSTADLYFSYATLLTKISFDGDVLWSEGLSSVAGNTGDTTAHGFHLFEEYPLVQTILNSNNVVYSKFNERGEEWSSRTTSMGGFNAGLVIGNPQVISYYPYSRTYVIYKTTDPSLYTIPGRNLVIGSSDVSIYYLTPTPPYAAVDYSQATYSLNGVANAVRYTPSSGSIIYYFDGSTISGQRNLSSRGIYPTITKFQEETENYVEFIESAIGFTEYQILDLQKIQVSTLNTIWGLQQVLPYHTYPTTVVNTDFNGVYVFILKDGKYLTIQRRDRSTGELLSVFNSHTEISEIQTIQFIGTEDLYVSYHEVSSTDPNVRGIRLARFNPNGNIVERWSVLLDNDLNEKYHTRIVQNISGRIFLAYVGKTPSAATGFVKLLAIGRTDGSVQWVKTLFEDVSPTERINGLDNEGSYVNLSRLGLRLLDSDDSTFDIVTKNNLYTGFKLRTFETVISGLNAYADNPLVIYNQGDGWTILVYVDVFGTFRMIRQITDTGPDIIQYNSLGYVVSPAGYPYYWRPNITIYPEISGSSVIDRTHELTDSGFKTGNFIGPYVEWWSNGHMKLYREFEEGGKEVGRKITFSRDGQYKTELIAPQGDGLYREWELPIRTDLFNLFKNYDTDGDGFLSSTELKTLIEEYGEIELAPEDFPIIMSRLDRDGDGKISLEEFKKIGQIEYTTLLPLKDLQHVVLTLSAQTYNGRKSGSQTTYHPFRPEGILRSISNYSGPYPDSDPENDPDTEKLPSIIQGPFVEYHLDGVTEKLRVEYDDGLKVGQQTERYSPELGGGISKISNFFRGNQLPYVVEYFPNGSLKIIIEEFADPRNPYTAFRHTTYFEAVPPNLNPEAYIYRRNFLDNNRLKNGLETIYSSPGVVESQIAYERGRAV